MVVAHGDEAVGRTHASARAWRAWPWASVGSDWGRLQLPCPVRRSFQAVAALVTQDMQRVTQVKGVAVGVGALIRRRVQLTAAVVIALLLTSVGALFPPSRVGLGMGALARWRFFVRTSAGRFMRR